MLLSDPEKRKCKIRLILVVQLSLSYLSFNIGKNKILELTQKVLRMLNYKDEDLYTVLSKRSIELEIENKLKVLTYITLMCENSVNEFKHILSNKNLKKSFVDYFIYITQNVNEFTKNEGSIVAIIRLLTYTHKLELNEQSQFQRTEMINKIIAASLNFYDNKNYIFVVYLINAFKAYFDIIFSPSDYIWYLQNLYLRSFEFYEIYTSLIENNEKVPKGLYNALILIVQLTSEYFEKDEDNDIKVSSIRKMTNLLMTIILNPKEGSFNELKPFWHLMHLVIKRDLNNVICGK
jgi:hypothetical protein